MRKPVIGISMGDPAGIGPEVTVKALNDPGIHQICVPLVIGDRWILQKELEKYAPEKNIHPVQQAAECRSSASILNVMDLNIPECRHVKPGKVSAEAGHAAFTAVTRMIELALAGEIHATVTGPIHKKAINEAGYHFAGHTEIFATYTSTEDYAMLLVCDQLKVIHVTTHVSLRGACDLIDKDRVLSRIRLLDQGLRKMGYENPRIGVAGLKVTDALAE